MHYGQGEVERAVEILVNMGREKKEYFFPLLLQEETADDRQVVVRNASLMTSGEFRCQVSGEGPLFATVTTSKMLRVAGTLVFLLSSPMLCYAIILFCLHQQWSPSSLPR